MADRSIEREWEKMHRQIADNIARFGQQVQIVYLTKDDPPGSQPFMYTIGNYQQHLPELLIVGTDKDMFADVLNRLGKIQRERGKAFADEELVSLGGKFPLRIVDAGEIGRRDYATFVGMFAGSDDYEVRQVLLPDPQGRWPDTPDCAPPYRDQPILSKLARSTH